jgi:hypothetical protein
MELVRCESATLALGDREMAIPKAAQVKLSRFSVRWQHLRYRQCLPPTPDTRSWIATFACPTSTTRTESGARCC